MAINLFFNSGGKEIEVEDDNANAVIRKHCDILESLTKRLKEQESALRDKMYPPEKVDTDVEKEKGTFLFFPMWLASRCGAVGDGRRRVLPSASLMPLVFFVFATFARRFESREEEEEGAVSRILGRQTNGRFDPSRVLQNRGRYGDEIQEPRTYL